MGRQNDVCVWIFMNFNRCCEAELMPFFLLDWWIFLHFKFGRTEHELLSLGLSNLKPIYRSTENNNNKRTVSKLKLLKSVCRLRWSERANHVQTDDSPATRRDLQPHHFFVDVVVVVIFFCFSSRLYVLMQLPEMCPLFVQVTFFSHH